jgi:carbonic anhydrase/acetyltransferase-like protein (isoleucine patch superfamily)
MSPQINEDCFIADTAVIIGNVTIESGASIWYGAVLRGDENSIFVGEGTNIQDNVTVHNIPTSPVNIGKNCSIGHGAIVHGCTIHNNVIIGINATILDGAEIHSGSIIGANVRRERKKVS